MNVCKWEPCEKCAQSEAELADCQKRLEEARWLIENADWREAKRRWIEYADRINVHYNDRDESLRLLSPCLGYLRTTATKADYESACRLLGKVPYEQEEPK